MSLTTVRQSRKNHPMPIEHQTQRKGRFGSAKKVSSEEAIRAPRTSDKRVFAEFPVTPPVKSNEMPSRGEGPERNSRTKVGRNDK